MTTTLLHLGILSLLLSSSARAQEAAEAAPAPPSFEEVRALVLPSEEELVWKRLGWHASLWEGVLAAQELEKPILLWAMNGHPLGCT